MKRRTQRGLTLIELMIAVAIGIILMTMAVPSFFHTVQNNRMATKANEFITDLTLARMEAVKRARPTGMCRSTDSSTCAGSGTNWETGWIVWIDTNNNGDVDSGEQLIRVHEGISGARLTGSAASVRYEPSGFLDPSETRTFTLEPPEGKKCIGNQIRTITVIPTGRPNITTSACAA